MSTDALIAKYIEIRDRKEELARVHKANVAKLDEALGRIEKHLFDVLTTQGAESLNTQAGCAFKTKRTSATVADWDAVLDYIKANERWDFLDRRVNKTAVQEFRDEHDDLPPGVNWIEDTVVQIRRAS